MKADFYREPNKEQYELILPKHGQNDKFDKIINVKLGSLKPIFIFIGVLYALAVLVLLAEVICFNFSQTNFEFLEMAQQALILSY